VIARARIFFLFVFTSSLLGSISFAQEADLAKVTDSESAGVGLPTVEQVQSRINQIQADRSIDATLKQVLIPIYESAVAELRLKSESEKQTKEMAAKAEAASSATIEAKRLQESPPPRDIVSANALRSYQQAALQSLLQSQQANYQTASDARAKIESTITARETAKKELPRTIADDRTALKKLSEKLTALPATDAQEPAQREAELLLLRVQIASTSEKIRRNEQELRLIEAEAELLPLVKARLTADERYYAGRLKEINDELNKRRETKIEEELKKVEVLTAGAPTNLRESAERLKKRASEWLDLARKNSSLQLEIEQSNARRDALDERRRIMTDRAATRTSRFVNGINNWNGLLLRRHRNELPDESKLTSQLDELLTKMQQTESQIIELEDWKSQNKVPASDESTKSYAGKASEEPGPLVHQADRLLEAEVGLVDGFVVDAKNYFDNLSKLAIIKQDMIGTVVDYRAFIDQQILWVRSAKPLGSADFQQLWPALQRVFEFENWKKAFATLPMEWRDRVWQPIVFVILWFALLFNASKLRRRSGSLCDEAARSTTTAFGPTFQVAFYTLILSLPLPMLLVFIGYRLRHAGTSQSFVDSLGVSFLVAARYFYPLEVIRQICRSGGLAEKHFLWPKESTSQMRTHIRWLIDLGIPLVAVSAFLFNLNEERFEHSLGRICFVVLMVLYSCFFAIVLRPKGGAFGEYLEKNQGGWIERLRYLWYGFAVVVPILLAANSLSGYHYTAIRLSMLCHTSLITMLGLFLIHELVSRWLMLSRRRIMTDQARQRLEEARQRELDATSHVLPPLRPAALESSSSEHPHAVKPVDLAELNAQTQSLSFSLLFVICLVSLGYIWSGVLPAVNALNSVHLWTVQGATPAEKMPITLANLLVAVPIIVFTYVAARNLPALLEIALLQRLPFDNAARYAISSISRYVISILGIVLVFNMIGVRWGSIQWLIAALGVGLGFGLQEIFANFVSGLILLFEQPIRVGDVITLGDTTGSVSRIRIRATTITNWDRQELIIPNKDLVTGRLLNWTLSDTTNRLVLNVGIAYGSNADEACRIILDICDKHPNVLTDPPATAFLDSFGDSTMNIIVRLFLGSLDTRVQTRHEILAKIHARFLEAHIEIAFPQRDLHIRSIPSSLSDFFISAISSRKKT
jgi:potassium efflux system protein